MSPIMNFYLLMTALLMLVGCAKGVKRGDSDGGKIVGNPVELPDLLTMDTTQAQTFGALQYTLKGEKLEGVFGLSMVNLSNDNMVILDQDLSSSNPASNLTTLAGGYDVTITVYPSAPSLQNVFLYGKENKIKVVAKAPGEDRYTTKGTTFEDFNAFSVGTSSFDLGEQGIISHFDPVQNVVVKNQKGHSMSVGLVPTLAQ